MNNKVTDLTGKTFGRLTIISFHRVNERRASEWVCRCSCGNVVIKSKLNCKEGSRSCGCITTERITKHGEADKTKEYRTWCSLKYRCLNPNNKRYKHYGLRGIKVCDEWMNSFEQFLSDMGRAPSPKHSIDRKNNDGDYEPGNCGWATDQEQRNNKQNNIIIPYLGRTQTLAQWCRELGIDYKISLKRLRARKWTIDRVFTSS